MSADAAPGTLLGGRYRLRRLLDRGGVGVVFEALDELLGRAVAVKLLDRRWVTLADQRERFRREASSVSRLSHPHIVQVSDFALGPNGEAFLVMELVDGESLARVLQRGERLQGERAARIALQVADALGAAHESGIVHRDLKPGNVLLRSTAAVYDWVTVIDFGVAYLAAEKSKLTATGELVGTPAYMAPEQAVGQAVDGRTDLYALGVVMYGMLAQRLPYARTEPGAVLLEIAAGRRQRLLEACPDVEPALAGIVERLLETAPANRFQSSDDLVHALSKWLEGRSTPFLPDTPRSDSREPASPSRHLRGELPSSPPTRPPAGHHRRERRGRAALVALALLGLGVVGGALTSVLVFELVEHDEARAAGANEGPPMRPVMLAPAVAELSVTRGHSSRTEEALDLARSDLARCSQAVGSAPSGTARFRVDGVGSERRVTGLAPEAWPSALTECVTAELERALTDSAGGDLEVRIRF